MTYTYDGDNWRTKKSNGELEWHDSFCNHGLITESDLSGNPTEEYIFFNGSRIARRDASGAVYYYFGDHLNSGRVMTDSNGITQQESEYYPFGYERVITNNMDKRHKFTGKKRDMESGLDYSHFRMLSSTVGRWASTDPEIGGWPTEAFGWLEWGGWPTQSALGLSGVVIGVKPKISSSDLYL